MDKKWDLSEINEPQAKSLGAQLNIHPTLGGLLINRGITDFEKVYSKDDMVKDDVIFAATGVTDGSLLKGARSREHVLETETILMRSKTGSVRRLLYQQKIDF